MCEHNLVIGKQYRLHAEKGIICAMCGYKWQKPEGVLTRYIGDELLNSHSFDPIEIIICPQCRYPNGIIHLPCTNNGTPIDVTQEFLSLPVRSRE